MLSALPAKQQNTTYTNYEKADASWFKKKKKGLQVPGFKSGPAD